SVPRAAYSEARHDRNVLRQWLTAVRSFGFAVMDGLPAESGALCSVADLFGYIRETNYGRWFEVRAEVNPNNLAYTNLGLQAHTDNPYRDPVPTLQILACIENTVEGGESSVVDGFAVAAALQAENSNGFRLLSSYPARFEYAGS
ncbi:MAG: gamma-butyrobetaine dioxygenase, partial [Mesorhizobium sp.]